MSERMDVYRCESCGAMAAMLRGGAGEIACCGAPMIFQLKNMVPVDGDIEPGMIPTMEHNVDMPIKNLLKMWQYRTTEINTYFGVQAVKCPTDFWIYLEIIYAVQPDVIIEIGNAHGGAALALAHFMDNMGKGKLIGLDITHDPIPQQVKEHPRITFITGDACASLDQVKAMIAPEDVVLVIEDSSHTYENTLNVMRTYGPLVTQGSYMIVEDSICHHGLEVGPNPGPYEALETFLAETDSFEVDRAKEAFMITWNPMGFLKKV